MQQKKKKKKEETIHNICNFVRHHHRRLHRILACLHRHIITIYSLKRFCIARNEEDEEEKASN